MTEKLGLRGSERTLTLLESELLLDFSNKFQPN